MECSSSSHTRPRPPSTGSNCRIECLILHSKGFICSGSNGSVYVFEKTDDPNVFNEVRSVSITDALCSTDTMGSGELSPFLLAV